MIRPTTAAFPLVSGRVLGRRPGATVTTRRPDGSLDTRPLDDVLSRARRLATLLLARGVRPGDRVATLLPNDRTSLEALLGVPLAGAVLHPLNPALSDETLAALLADGEDRVLLATPDALDRALGLLPEGASPVRLAADTRLEVDLTAADPDTPLPELHEDHPFAMVHTSGTTGVPKAIVHSHRAVWLHALSSGLVSGFGVSPRDTILSMVPVHHALAIGFPLAAALHGASLVLPGAPLSPHALLDLVIATETTLTGGLSSHFARVLDALDAFPGRWTPREDLRIVAGGNALHQPAVLGFARHGIELVHTWGMTETGPLATTHRPALPSRTARGPVPQGRPVPLVDVRVVDEEDAVLPWDGRAEGELQVRGAWISSGTLDGPRPDPNGWLRTGDRATIDADGCVRLVGRIKEGLRIGERWVGPESLEACVRGHDAIADIAFVGLPDRHLGERPVAAVVLHGPCPDLRALVPPSLLDAAVAIEVRVVADLPRGATGKLDRRALRETLLPQSGTELPPHRTPARQPSP